MKNLVLAALPLLATSLLIPACSSPSTDELAGETSDDDVVDGKADSAVDGAYTYFELTADQRKCASPICGGFFLDRLNRTTTLCHDHAARAACYTPVLDMSESGLSDASYDKLVEAANQSAAPGVRAIVRGRFASTNTTTPRPELGRFIVTEVWLSQTEAVSDGVFAKVKDAGIRCIAAPCPSMREKGLNTTRSAMIAEVDYAEAGLDDAQLEAVVQDLFTPSGLIIAGDRFTVHEGGRKAKGRTATAVFRRLAEPVEAACFVGGCSGQICSDQEGVISTCEFLPEYACYQTATCERQAGGACGWTETPELATCLGH
ncbi:MAG: hypothetical protein H6Q90_5280 [Deltaproteobacteria bacterium]|nr:hypothetical protein [Deltaproteobacteria bacterium]